MLFLLCCVVFVGNESRHACSLYVQWCSPLRKKTKTALLSVKFTFLVCLGGFMASIARNQLDFHVGPVSLDRQRDPMKPW